MKKPQSVFSAALLLLAGAAAAGDYDFFDLARYPEGGRLKPGVDLYEVKEAGGPADRYTRRVVRWWPRRGVDVIDVQEGMIEREWTMAADTLDGAIAKAMEGRADLKPDAAVELRPREMPGRFRAHLIGFDGIGNDIGDPYKGEDFFEPSVILRMADGSRRCFRSGTFCQKDREFILGVYVREMKRVQGTLDQTVYSVRPRTLKEYPGGTPIGQPGSLLLQSEHFVVPSGSQAPGGDKDRWLNAKRPEVAARLRECVFNMFEHMHAYLEYGGHLMPYWDRREKYKYEVHVGGTILDGYKKKGGGAGGGYGGQGMGWLGANPGGFGHEYGHGMSIQWRVGDGEILAQSMMELTDNRCTSYDHNTRVPWRNCVHAEYNSCLFYRTIGYDPNWGLLAVTAMPAAKDERMIFQTLARLGQQRGLFKDGIRGLGDMVGDYSARLAEFDTLNQYPLQMRCFAARRNYLEPVDVDKGVYRIPWDEAPEPFGANIIRLLPGKDSKRIEVDFQGYHDPAVYSDWRACIVAVDRQGRARYSDLWNKGPMAMPRREGDRRYWLTVAATPAALNVSGSRSVYEGRYAPRYPWQVTLRGAVPGAPHRSRADLDDVDCAFGDRRWLKAIMQADLVPAPPSGQTGRRFLGELGAVVEALQRRRADANEDQKRYCDALLRKPLAELAAARGAAHANGGGWVAATAKVAPTAYVGPGAMVLDEAKVLDHAIVEDYAVIRDQAVISGRARVSGQAIISGQTRLAGFQPAWMPLELKADEVACNLTPRWNENLDENGLWAHYAMDQAESVMLEDYYRQHAGGDFREFFVSVMNGYLHGRPRFVDDGGRRGFAFDGKTQHADLNRRVADLPEITVDMTVKRQGAGEQTLLDFGSGVDNRFTLTARGPDGRLAFAAVVDGRPAAAVTSDRALPKDKWSRVRVEIDGRRIALWIDDRPAGEADSAFRPLHVFKPGRAQRNFIAAARDGTARFRGVFDNVVVYHRVHGEAFTKLPPPYRDAPRRPEKGFARSVLTSMGASPFEQADRAERITEAALNDWHCRAGEAITHLMELKLRVPQYVQAVEAYQAFELWRKQTGAKLRKEFLESGKSKDGEAGAYVDRKLREAGLVEKELAANDQLTKATELVRQRYYLEYHTLCSFLRQNFHGFYNTRISSYIRSHARKIAGGAAIRDNLDEVARIEALHAPENWKTRVDQWDWRTRWEKDGSIANLPLTRKWLTRVRGTGPLPAPPPAAVPAEPPLETLSPAQQIRTLEERLARLRQVDKDARAAVAALPASRAAQAQVARLQEQIKPLEPMAKARLNELRAAEATDPRMLAWNRAEAHIPYSREWKRTVRALGEARGKVRGAYQHRMREELKARDPAFRTWADLNARLEDLKRQELYRLHLYLLRHTDHPNLLGKGRSRGELEETARKLNSARKLLQQKQSRAAVSDRNSRN